jgi:tRNA(fMet)-specific endonuclease VapC
VRYLVDTDWIISGLGAVPGVVELLSDLAGDGLAISVITLGEVFDGAYGHPDPPTEFDRYRRFFAGYALLPVTEDIAARFAEVRAFLRRQGQPIGDLDVLIAATALDHDLTLVTRNLRHFERIPNLKLYRPDPAQ